MRADPPTITHTDPNVAELLSAPAAELEARMREGAALAPADVAGFEYRGVSVGLPALIERYVKKFKKAFVEDLEGCCVRGWNLRMQQTGLDDLRWEPLRVAGRPLTYGHFTVERAPDQRYPSALYLDYGQGLNLPLDPTSRVRDYVVGLDGAELLLGRMFIDIGFRLQPTPSYFVLMRDEPIPRAVATPRARMKRHGQELTRTGGRSI